MCGSVDVIDGVVVVGVAIDGAVVVDGVVVVAGVRCRCCCCRRRYRTAQTWKRRKNIWVGQSKLFVSQTNKHSDNNKTTNSGKTQAGCGRRCDCDHDR